MDDFRRNKNPDVDLSKPSVNWYEALGTVMFKSVKSYLVEDRAATVRHYSQVSLRSRSQDLYDEVDVYADLVPQEV